MAVPVTGHRVILREQVPQLTPEDREEVAALLTRLETDYADSVSRVILYGSKARGTGEPESDIDLLIVAKDGAERVKQAVEASARSGTAPSRRIFRLKTVRTTSGRNSRST